MPYAWKEDIRQFEDTDNLTTLTYISRRVIAPFLTTELKASETEANDREK